jgi:ubiquinone/menaquinone biosynthesis C-methylase UbiE
MSAVDAADLAGFRARQEAHRAQAYARFFAPVTGQFAGAAVDAVAARRTGPAAPVIDLGCGDGVLLREMARRGWSACGVDHSVAMARLAGRTGCPVLVGDAQRLPFAGRRFGALVGGFVLAHIDLPATVGEASRVLQLGAPLVLTGWAPVDVSPFTGLATELLRERADAPRRQLLDEAVRRSDADWLAEQARHAGLRSVTVTTVYGLATVPSVEAWWGGMLAASTGFADLLYTQQRALQREVRDGFFAEADRYRVDADEVIVPVAAVVLAGIVGEADQCGY